MSEDKIDYRKHPAIANSDLSILADSPARFKAIKDGLIEKKETKETNFGSLVHTILLEPDTFDSIYAVCNVETPSSQQQKGFCEHIVNAYIDGTKLTVAELYVEAFELCYSTKNKSADKIRQEAETLYKSLKDYIKYLANAAGKIEISERELYLAQQAVAALIYDECINELVIKDTGLWVRNEVEIFWIEPVTGVQCKSKVDRIVIDEENKVIRIIDIKTINHIDAIALNIKKYDLKRQAGSYESAVMCFLSDIGFDISEYRFESYLAFVESREFPLTSLVRLSKEELLEGKQRHRDLLEDYKWHMETGNWSNRRSYLLGDIQSIAYLQAHEKEVMEWEME